MQWREQEPDFKKHPISQLTTGLSVFRALQIVLRLETGPVVIFDQRTLNSIQLHLSEARIELGGLLVGNVFSQPNLGFDAVTISKHVRADNYTSTGVSLRMENEVWEAARKLIKPDEFVVGWYHSHPDLGAFFSSTDRSTQRKFFGHNHSIGLVIDPIREQAKTFMGAESQEVTDLVMVQDREIGSLKHLSEPV